MELNTDVVCVVGGCRVSSVLCNVIFCVFGEGRLKSKHPFSVRMVYEFQGLV